MTFHPKGSKDWGDPKKNACLKYIFICLLVKFFIAGLEWFLLHTDWDEKKKRAINSVGQECKKSKTPNDGNKRKNKRNGQRCCHNIFRKLYR